MSKSNNLYLLTTLGCSLCNKAKQQLWPVLSGQHLTLVEVELTDYPDLLALFATQIPVITLSPPEQMTAISKQLSWPFTQAQVHQLVIESEAP